MSFILNSGIKIFDVLEFFYRGVKDRRTMCRKLAERGINVEIFAVSKYLRTLYWLGYEIVYMRKHYYSIIKTPFKISDKKYQKNLPLFLDMLDFIYEKKENFQRSTLENKLAFITETKPVSEIVYDLEPSITEAVYFENNTLPALQKIQYKNKTIRGKITGVRYAKNGIFVICEGEKIKTRHVMKTENIKCLKKCAEEPKLEGTVFKLTGRLRDNYILRYGEKARYSEEEVFVTNYYEDKKTLFERLVKYGPQCEVVLPKSDRRKFKKKVKELVEYYKSM